jgi:hypothetical protein
MRLRSLIFSSLFLLALLALAGTPRPRATSDDPGEPTPPWECTIIAGELACIGGDGEPTPTPTPTPGWECTIVAGEVACIEPRPRVIQGQIRRRDDGVPIAGVEVILEGPLGVTITETDLDGQYVFELGGDGPWRVEPRDVTDPAPGVSSLDAAYVAQSVVGVRSLASEQALACDVTGSGKLTSLDAAFIVRYVVGLTPQLPLARKCASDWLFFPVPEAAPGQSVVQPNAAGRCRMGAITIDAVDEAAAGQDFEAVAIGDCSSTTPQPSGPRFQARRAASPVQAVAFAGRLRRSDGGKLALPLFVRSGEPVYALDARLFFDPTRLRATRARLAGPSRGIYLAFNGDYDAGVAALALASATSLPLDADGNFALFVYFEPLDRSSASPPIGLSVLVDEQPALTK